MQIIKNLFSRVTVIWSLYGYMARVNAALKSWPGTNDEIRLRAWLLDHLALLAGSATKTVNQVDDAVVLYTVRIIENDTAWKVLFNMLSLTDGLRNIITGNANDTKNITEQYVVEHDDGIGSLYAIENALKTNGNTNAGIDANANIESEDTQDDAQQEPGNPLLIISAVGLILQIIQYLRNR